MHNYKFNITVTARFNLFEKMHLKYRRINFKNYFSLIFGEIKKAGEGACDYASFVRYVRMTKLHSFISGSTINRSSKF